MAKLTSTDIYGSLNVQGQTLISSRLYIPQGIDGNLIMGSGVGRLTLLNNSVNNRTYTIPDVGVNSSFVMTNGDQVISGTKIFEDLSIGAVGQSNWELDALSPDSFYLRDSADNIRLTVSNEGDMTVARSLISNGNGVFTGTISASNLAIGNWNSAFGWGDHALENYIKTRTKLRANTSPYIENDITLSAGSHVTLSQSGNTITINSANNTYSAGTGLTLSGSTFNHTNSITAGNTGPSSNSTLAFSGTFTVPYVSYDAQGHITGTTNRIFTMPANPNTDTKNTAGATDISTKIFLVGAGSQTANPQTYTDNEVFVTNGKLDAREINTSGDVAIGGSLTVTGNIITNNVEMISTSNGIVFEGATNDDFETTLKAIDPTADRIIQLPNASGTIALTTDLPTVNNGTLTISNGGGITGSGTFTANQSGNTPITISHADTSSQPSVSNSGRTVLQSVTLDTYGHVTGITSATLADADTITRLRGTTSGTFTEGDITLIPGSNVSISQTGKNITISSANDNTTYSAGTGLTLSGTTFNHTNSITAGNVGPSSNAELVFSGTFSVPYLVYDAQGHITGASTRTLTLPANPNISVTDNGTGAFVTDVTSSGHTITLSRGNFTETTLSKGTSVGSGNAVTDISVSGHQITLTKGTTFLTAESDTLATVTSRGNTTTNNLSTGALIITGSLTSGGGGAYSNYVEGADNIILKGNAAGVSGLFFESEKNGTPINHPSDYAFIQYHPYGIGGSTGESGRLVIGISNDATTDRIVLNPPGANDLVVRLGIATTEYKVWHEANDGSGSGLDADLLDGQHGSYYLDNTITDISITHNATTVVVNSSDGTNGTINGATTTTSGVVTNAAQEWAGSKTFRNGVTVKDGANTGNSTMQYNSTTKSVEFIFN